MKAASISTILSVLSLIAVGAMFVKMENLSDQIRPLTERRADADRRQFDPVDDYEREPGARPIADESEARDEPFGSDGQGTSTAKSRSDNPATRWELERRIAQLEKKQSRPSLPFRMPKFARSVSDLSKTLKLTKTQEARVQDVVDRTKQRIEDIMKIPDETGVSPHARRQKAREKMQEAMKTGKWGDMTSALMASRQDRQKTIPGRNTTYGEEVDRIKKEAREEINSDLTVEQQQEFKDTRVDSMLGDSGGSRTVMAFHGGPGGEKTDGGAVIIEGSVDISTDRTATEDSPKKDDE